MEIYTTAFVNLNQFFNNMGVAVEHCNLIGAAGETETSMRNNGHSSVRGTRNALPIRS